MVFLNATDLQKLFRKRDRVAKNFFQKIFLFSKNVFFAKLFVKNPKNLSEKKFITGEMTIAEILELYPSTMEILAEWALGCAGCHIGEIETIAEGAAAHGFDDEEIENLLEELNDAAALDAEVRAAEKTEK